MGEVHFGPPLLVTDFYLLLMFVGHGRHLQELSPVRIVKNPDGSLAQAAMMQGALSKERREQKMQARDSEAAEQPQGPRRNWNDPVPDSRHLSVFFLFFFFFVSFFSENLF